MNWAQSVVCLLALAAAIILTAGDALAGEHHVTFVSREDRLVLDATTVEGAQLIWMDAVGPVIELRLQPEAAAWVARITRDRIGEELQVVYRDKVVVSPIIQEPIERGQLVIAGFTDEEAKAVIDSLPFDWVRSD